MTRTGLTIFLAAAALAGCGHAPPSQELVEARETYKQASQSEAKDLVPDQLLDAREALDAAESAYDDDGNSGKAKTLAYIADRKAKIAMAGAGSAAAKKSREEAEREYKELLEVVAKSSRAKLGKTETNLEKTKEELAREQKELEDRQKQLADQQKQMSEQQQTLQQREQELAKEKAARADAEAKLAAAMKSLQEIANVKEDQRGTIITLSGAVLFKSNQADLLPIAEQQLIKVADALNAYDAKRTIVVEGHTDSRGSADANRRLSQERAESVRGFLVSHGVMPERIRAVGKGEDEPVADNRTAEGRANNRRVEIVIEGASKPPGG